MLFVARLVPRRRDDFTDDAAIDEWSSHSLTDDHGHDQPPVLPVEDQPMASGPSTHSPSAHWGGADENQCS